MSDQDRQRLMNAMANAFVQAKGEADHPLHGAIIIFKAIQKAGYRIEPLEKAS